MVWVPLLSMPFLRIWISKISRDGYVHHDHYERGIPTIELEEGLLPKLRRTSETGTKINFLPDPEIFEKTRFQAEEVKSRLHETAYLNPELTIIFEDRRGDESSMWSTMSRRASSALSRT